ncbi:energy transducer TonB [Sulfurimonas sp.]|uniref:energy transducer TonB n=1 Tax=Sulfurimonas sp. TaxID=2022749 RepID=UPI0025EC5CB6|nr:TonB family protein [Sulfurimonas sp.]
MIKKSEDFSFLIGAIISTFIMVSILLAQNIAKSDDVSISTSKTESIHYVSIINTTKKVEKKEPKKPIKKPQKKKKKVLKKIVKKQQVIDEKALIQKKLVQEQKLLEEEQNEKRLEQEKLVQLQKEKLAKEEEYRKSQLAKKNLLEKEKNIYLSELAVWIKKHLKYPRQARRMNQEGVVEISFIITKQGDIKSVEIGSPCPYKRLNAAAKSLLVKLNRFKPLPENLDRWELNVPIIYALKD